MYPPLNKLFIIFWSDVYTIEQIVYFVAQLLNKLLIMYLTAMYLTLNTLFILWLRHWTNCTLCISQRCFNHWTNSLLCISQQCIYHWTNCFIYILRCSVSTIEQIVYFVAQPLNKLFIMYLTGMYLTLIAALPLNKLYLMYLA